MNTSSTLWNLWTNLLKKDPNAIALINAETGETWTRARLTETVSATHPTTPKSVALTKIAFPCSNSLSSIAIYLGIFKNNSTAIPLDPLLSEERQLSLAHSLGATHWIDSDFKIKSLSPRRSPSKAALIKLTSGTISLLPKAIPCRASHLIADGRAIIRGMGILPTDVNLALIPLNHSYAIGNILMPLILQGTPAVLASQYLVSQIPHWIQQYNVTIFPSVPDIFRMLIAMPPSVSLEPLRLAISAGAPLSKEVAENFYKRFALDIHNFYGSSETGGITYDKKGHLTRLGLGLGTPLPGVKATVSPRGILTIQSPAVATRSGSFRISDRAKILPNGILQIIGRSPRLAKIAGKRLDVSEIEYVLQQMPKITGIFLCVHTHQHRDTVLAALETTHSRKAILAHLQKHLLAWKQPHYILIRKRLPRNSRGKLDTQTIRVALLQAASATLSPSS